MGERDRGQISLDLSVGHTSVGILLQVGNFNFCPLFFFKFLIFIFWVRGGGRNYVGGRNLHVLEKGWL